MADSLVDVARGIREAVGGDAAAVYLVTANGLEPRGVDGDAATIPADLASRAAEQGTMVVDGDSAAAPFVVEGGRVIGAVAVHAPTAPTSELQAAADLAVIAVEIARAHEAERQARLAAEAARSHLALLARVSEVFDSALDQRDPALHALADVLVPDFADWCLIDLTGVHGRPRFRSVRHGHADAAGQLDEVADRHPGWTAPVRAAAETGEAELGWGLTRREPADDFESVLAAFGVESWIVLPIRVRGVSLGVIVLGRHTDRRGFRSSDVEAGRDAARRAAVALERIALYQETKQAAEATARQADQLRRLMQAAPEITASLLPTSVLDVFVNQACRVLGAKQVVVDLPHLPLRVSSVPAGEEDDETEALIAEIEQAYRASGETTTPSSWLAIPIATSRGRDAEAGVVVVVGKERGAFTAEDEAIIVSMAQLAAASLENAKLYLDVQANRERLRGVVEATPLAIVELDRGHDRAVSWWNRAAQDIFGWPAMDEAAVAAGPSFPAAVAEAIEPMVAAAEDGEPALDVEVAWPRADGARLELSVTVVPLFQPDGSVTGVLAVLNDVTKRKALEQRLLRSQRMEAIGRLAGGVAHDFNNLLTVILGYSDLALRRIGDGEADARLRSDVESIRRAGAQGANLTRQLLEMGSHQVSDPVVLSVDEVVSTMENVLRRLVAEDIDLALDLRPALVLMDPGQLEQVVLNLVVNAADAMPDGGRLRVAASVEPGSVVITVEDTGVGMEPDVLAHCFEPFFTTKERTTGTGLGLATVFGIVEQYDGRIEIDSRVGKGTTVRVHLPEADPPAEDDARPKDAPRPRRSSGGRGRVVLLVEDDEALRRLVADVLGREGYVLLEASNGTEALKLAGSHDGEVDVLVTDVVMPEMDGIELARRLLERRPRLPVVYMSGYTGGARDKLRHLSPSANFLAKPFKPEDVARRVHDLLEGTTARSGSRRP